MIPVKKSIFKGFFLHVFANMQMKLSQDSGRQLSLLKELLDLQQDMVVMLLSMLEGICPYLLSAL